MTIKEPRWTRYAEYELVNGFPVCVGLRKDTPEDIRKEFEQDQK